MGDPAKGDIVFQIDPVPNRKRRRWIRVQAFNSLTHFHAPEWEAMSHPTPLEDEGTHFIDVQVGLSKKCRRAGDDSDADQGPDDGKGSNGYTVPEVEMVHFDTTSMLHIVGAQGQRGFGKMSGDTNGGQGAPGPPLEECAIEEGMAEQSSVAPGCHHGTLVTSTATGDIASINGSPIPILVPPTLTV